MVDDTISSNTGLTSSVDDTGVVEVTIFEADDVVLGFDETISSNGFEDKRVVKDAEPDIDDPILDPETAVDGTIFSNRDFAPPDDERILAESSTSDFTPLDGSVIDEATTLEVGVVTLVLVGTNSSNTGFAPSTDVDVIEKSALEVGVSAMDLATSDPDDITSKAGLPPSEETVEIDAELPEEGASALELVKGVADTISSKTGLSRIDDFAALTGREDTISSNIGFAPPEDVCGVTMAALELIISVDVVNSLKTGFDFPDVEATFICEDETALRTAGAMVAFTSDV